MFSTVPPSAGGVSKGNGMYDILIRFKMPLPPVVSAFELRLPAGGVDPEEGNGESLNR